MRYPIRWVDGTEPDLRGRSIRLWAEGRETGLPELLSSAPVPDGEFVCDICNVLITTRPFPIVTGYALCPGHQKKWGIEDGQRFYEEVP